VKYGEWIAQCIYLSESSWWQQAWCASQYYPANPDDFSTWGLSDARTTRPSRTRVSPATTRHAALHHRHEPQRSGSVDAVGGRLRDRHAAAGTRQDLESWCNPPDGASASSRRPIPATSWSTRTCGSRCRVSRTGRAAAGSVTRWAASTRCGGSSTPRRASGSRSRRASWLHWPTRR
jgi:hypothetical protein